ncbi:long-chain acyl-CoA synthetase [Murinocardiopsis flavida]|uniref:Acyl-CoA synthetase n=1 Tax=Murinocardiopsis flavida TaxID=645275 RepID=A0A2P8D3P7_9ACTN|nr:AMP-dependent synthetase/ligase [Murinocardiopsis flavida]PSK91826.1 long-chain acyl-CoA synthetase [Murinocardiopsis flavida]
MTDDSADPRSAPEGGAPAERSAPARARPPASGGLAEPVFAKAAAEPSAAVLARKGPDGWYDVTAAEFAAEVSALARGIAAAGIEPGDRVGLLAENAYEWTLFDYAVWSAGAIGVPIYPSSSDGQTTWILSDSGARACVVDTAERAAQLASLRGSLPELRHVWCVADGAVGELVDRGADAAPDEIERRRAAVAPSDTATIVYTSGTTGAPKGCVLTHANFFAEVDNIIADLPDLFHPDSHGEGPRTLLFLPLAHVFGRMVQVCALHAGVLLGHTPSVRSLLADLAAFQPTFLLAVPYVLEKVHDNARGQAGGGVKGRIFEAARAHAVAYSEALDTGGPTWAQRIAHRVFDRLVYAKIMGALGGRATRAITGGGALEPRLLHFFRGIGLEVVEGYGLTETTAAVVANRPGRIRPGTVGTPLPGAAVRLAEDGEILVQGAQVFDRYWNNEDATREAFRGGWFATGDLGAFDAAGDLRIIGRKKEILVTAGGKNVIPGPTEERVREHPLVYQCMVVGDGRPYVTALVTLDAEERAGMDDAAVDAAVQEAVDAANRHVSKAESIRRFTVLPSPFTEADGTLTPTLKLRRPAILRHHAAEIEGMYG